MFNHLQQVREIFELLQAVEEKKFLSIRSCGKKYLRSKMFQAASSDVFKLQSERNIKAEHCCENYVSTKSNFVSECGGTKQNQNLTASGGHHEIAREIVVKLREQKKSLFENIDTRALQGHDNCLCLFGVFK